jgi:tight adherence protein B
MINPGRFNTKELTTLASGIAFIGASTVIIAHSNAKKTPGKQGHQEKIVEKVNVLLSTFSTGEFSLIFALSIFATGTALSLSSSPILGSIVFAITALGGVRGLKIKKETKIRVDALRSWPLILSELQLRIGTMGAPLPNALFSSGKSAPPTISKFFHQAERNFSITGSFDSALAILSKGLNDSGTSIVTELLSVAKDAPGSDLMTLISDLQEDRQAEWDRQSEYEARLAGVRFAKYFVIIVPLGMLGAGSAIAGTGPYQSSLGQLGLVLSLLVLIATWVWASRLSDPKRLYATLKTKEAVLPE